MAKSKQPTAEERELEEKRRIRSIWWRDVGAEMDQRIKNETAGSMMREYCPEILNSSKGETNIS